VVTPNNLFESNRPRKREPFESQPSSVPFLFLAPTPPFRFLVFCLFGRTDSPLSIVSSSGLEDLSEDGDGGVDGVGDDENEGFGTVLGDSFGEVSADSCVDLEERGEVMGEGNEGGRRARWRKTRRSERARKEMEMETEGRGRERTENVQQKGSAFSFY